MNIESQPRDDHQVTLIVELETEQMDSAKHRAARKISERKSVPGFRPGKAPYEVVLRTFGEAAISEEAVDILLEEIYPKVLEESGIEPAAAGSLEKAENLDKKPKFTFTVPLSPVVELGDYRSIRLPHDWKEPGKEKTVEAINELRQMYAKTETVNRPIVSSDFVMIDLKGYKSGAAQDEAPVIERAGMPIFIKDNGKEDEYPFKGFSKELIGLSAEEGKSFNHKYPKDYKDDSLQGQTINFEIKVKMVRGSILPELDDEFAKQVGPFDNMQALEDAVKANIATRSKAEYDDEYFSKLMEQIKEKAIIKYPPQVLDHELEHVIEDLKSRLAQQGMDLASYIKSRDMDEEKFKSEEAKPIAIKRLERSLIMDELAKKEKIEVSQEVLQSSFENTWGEFQGDASFQKTMRGKSQPPKQLMNAIAMESANRAYVQLTLDRLKDIANGNSSELPVDDDKKKSDTASLKNKKSKENKISPDTKSSKSTIAKKSAKIK